MVHRKKRILLFSDWYFPGYNAGGPIQSCRNIVSRYSDQFDFYIFTSNKDLGSKDPYSDVISNSWVEISDGENVFYSESESISFSTLKELIKHVEADVVYINSMFSYRFSILPLLVLRAISFSGKIVLAPRGMLHAGALGLKSFKKKIFLKVFRAFNFHKTLFFHATDKQEVADINCVFPKARVMYAENIPRINSEPLGREKTGGRLKLIFISRIHPTKNLLFLLEILASSSLNGNIEVGIYGNPEQSGYFEKCMILMQKLPKNILVEYKGGVPAHLVFNTIGKYHAFVLPTLGENFGHAIFEALSCGLPVVISDRTPWRNLNTLHAGWDISLSDKDGFERAIQELIDMTEETYNYWSSQSRSLAEEYMQKSNFDLKYSALFS